MYNNIHSCSLFIVAYDPDRDEIENKIQRSRCDASSSQLPDDCRQRVAINNNNNNNDKTLFLCALFC